MNISVLSNETKYEAAARLLRAAGLAIPSHKSIVKVADKLMKPMSQVQHQIKGS